MHIDPMQLDYHAVAYSGCSHKLAMMYDNIPLVQRLFRMGYLDFNTHVFAHAALFPFKQLIKGQPSQHNLLGTCKIQLLAINHELDYFHPLSLN